MDRFITTVGFNMCMIPFFVRLSLSVYDNSLWKKWVFMVERHDIETFPCYRSFVREIHWWPVDSLHKESATRSVVFVCFVFMYALTNGWTDIAVAGDLRRHDARVI